MVRASIAGWCIGLLLFATSAIGCSDNAPESTEDTVQRSSSVEPAYANSLWYAGTFSSIPQIPAGSCDFHTRIVDHIKSRPLSADYVEPDQARQDQIVAMFEAIYGSIEASLTQGQDGDWSHAIAVAKDAGYELRRLYDEPSGRWFLHGYDPSNYDAYSCAPQMGDGGAYFWINPEPGRNLVIEVPHYGVDKGTEIEGANLFVSVAARALTMNGAERCASMEPTYCLTGATKTCGGVTPLSDVAHSSTNAFYWLHKGFEDRHHAYFFQIHQNVTSHQLGIVADGTVDTNNPSSPSITFFRALLARVEQGGNPDNSNWDSIQNCQTDLKPTLCGTYNTQAQYTNAPASDSCEAEAQPASVSGRFLHFEQAQTMTDDLCERTGRCWTSVSAALLATWGSETTKYNGGAFGPRQDPGSNVSAPNPPAGNSPSDNSPSDNSPSDNSPSDNSPSDNSPSDNSSCEETCADADMQADDCITDSWGSWYCDGTCVTEVDWC